MSSAGQDYVLGVHDAELARLGLQHRAWRARALELWRKGGLREGMRALDFGCGPGYASVDLAEIVGAAGEVLAVDRAGGFLGFLRSEAERRGLGQIHTREVDLAASGLELGQFDFAWARWIFAFTPDREAALDNLVAALKPGGVAAVQEYIEYGAWRMLPREPAIERFCAFVMQSWRDRGGEPNAAEAVIAGLLERGLEIVSVAPACEVVAPADPLWDWPETFVQSNVPRLIDLGDLGAGEGAEILAAWERAKTRPGGRMVTPLTGLILARKPDAAAEGA